MNLFYNAECCGHRGSLKSEFSNLKSEMETEMVT